jgi:hypothetical protein
MSGNITTCDYSVLDSLAGIAIKYWRSGRVPEDAEAHVLDRLPIIDVLREKVSKDDIVCLLSQVKSRSEAGAGLACSLLRNYIDDPVVREHLESRWDSASPYLKMRLMWRIVEAQELDPKWLDVFLEFILTNRAIFESFNREFYGASEEGLQRLLGRIEAQSFRPQKLWMYWLCVPSIVPNGEAAEALMRKGIDSGDEFTQNAIRQYLEK